MLDFLTQMYQQGRVSYKQLQPLIIKGTITQEQYDEIKASV